MMMSAQAPKSTHQHVLLWDEREWREYDFFKLDTLTEYYESVYVGGT